MQRNTLTWEATYCPKFEGLSCFILPGAYYGQVVMMMASVGFKKAAAPEEADLVVFIGGVDVDPKLYGETNVKSQTPNPDRDNYEKAVFDMCRRRDIPMFGICRGAQFLHVMNGGKLWQHVDGHAGPDHYIVDLDTDTRVMATSQHHQMLRDNEQLRVIAVSEQQISRSFISKNLYISPHGASNDFHEIEIEAGAYDSTNCFFVQGHPEVGDGYFKSWTMHRLKEFLFNDCAVEAGKGEARAEAAKEDDAMVAMVMAQIG